MELTCAEVLRELSNYLDEDVTDELRARIDGHVRACPGCRAVYDGVRNVLLLAGGVEVIALPAGFSERLRRRLAATVN